MSARGDRLAGLAFAAAGAALALHARTMPVPDLMGDVGPGFMPMVVGVAMAALGALLAATARPGGGPEPIEPARVPVAIAFAAFALAYAAGFAAFGFSWPTFLSLLAGMTLLGRRSWRLFALQATGAACFVLVLGQGLKRGLGIPLVGVWFG
jgi:hypothetical protein